MNRVWIPSRSLSDKGMKIRISKTPSQRGTMQVATPMTIPAMIPEARQSPPAGIAAVPEPQAARAVEAPKSTLLDVKSPMVGTFYGSPEPGAKPYVAVGSMVKKGQIVCIIEAMKIMNEIESEYAGVVKEVGAADAHPVEYGQVLFRIELQCLTPPKERHVPGRRRRRARRARPPQLRPPHLTTTRVSCSRWCSRMPPTCTSRSDVRSATMRIGWRASAARSCRPSSRRIFALSATRSSRPSSAVSSRRKKKRTLRSAFRASAASA